VENLDGGLAASFVYGITVGLPEDFARFLAVCSLLLLAGNAGWYAYARPIRHRYATKSIYSSEYQEPVREDPWLPARNPAEKPWYEIQEEWSVATTPWPTQSARRHAALADTATKYIPPSELPPPPEESGEIAVPPPPPPADFVPGPTPLPQVEALEPATPSPGSAPVPRKPEESIDFLLDRAQHRRLAGELTEALWDYDKVLEKDPDHLQALEARADILRVLGRPSEALEALERLLGLDPTHQRALLSQADILERSGRLDEALESYEKVTKGKPEYVEALRRKASILMTLGENDLALTALKELLRLDPGDREAAAKIASLTSVRMGTPRVGPGTSSGGKKVNIQELQGKGIGYFHVGMYEEALRSFEEILADEPKNIFAVLSKAKVLDRMGRSDEAVEACRKAVELDSREPAALAALGELLLKLGREDEARNHFNRAAQLDPVSGNADERIEKYKAARLKLEEFLRRLGEAGVLAEPAAELLKSGYGTMKALESTSLQELLAVGGLDAATAKRILDEARREAEEGKVHT
jgi:tetratricopeptide (TPR) repeat protein